MAAMVPFKTTDTLTQSLEALGTHVDAETFLIRTSLVALGVATITTVTTLLWPLGIDALAEGLIIAALTFTLPLLYVTEMASRYRSALRHELSPLLAVIAADLRRGKSLTASLITLSDRTPPSWRPIVREISDRLSRGEDFESTIAGVDRRIGDPQIHASLNLLARAWHNHSASALLDSLLERSLERSHHLLIARSERDQQLIWIPVAIATLVPGMIVLFVPLLFSLKTLIGA